MKPTTPKEELEKLNELFNYHGHFGLGGGGLDRCTSFDEQEREMLIKAIQNLLTEARIDELKELQMAPNISDDAKDENWTGYISDRLQSLKGRNSDERS